VSIASSCKHRNRASEGDDVGDKSVLMIPATLLFGPNEGSARLKASSIVLWRSGRTAFRSACLSKVRPLLYGESSHTNPVQQSTLK